MYQNSTAFSLKWMHLLTSILFVFFFSTSVPSIGQCPGTACDLQIVGGEPVIFDLLLQNSGTNTLSDNDLSNVIQPDGGCGYPGGTTTFDYLVFSSSPNVGDMPVSSDREFGCDNIGANTVYVVLEDINDGTNGEFDECDGAPVEVTVNVSDNRAPELLDPADDCASLNLNYTCDDLEADILDDIETEVESLYTDNCGIATVVAVGPINYPNTANGCPAPTDVEVTITDENDNETVCTVSIEVADDTDPEWIDPTDASDPSYPDATIPDEADILSFDVGSTTLRVNLSCGMDDDVADVDTRIAEWSAWEPKATDACNSASVTLSSETVTDDWYVSVNTSNCRVYRKVLVWELEDECGNAPDNFTVIIRVFDEDSPVYDPTTPAFDTIPNDPGECFADLTSSPANDPISYEAEDCQQSTLTYEHSVLSADPEAEFLALNGLASLPVNEPGQPAAYIYPVGEYQISYTATDLCGNDTTKIVNLVIEDTEAPMIVRDCPADITENTVGSGCTNTLNWVPPLAEDNCSGAGSITTEVTFSDPDVILNVINPDQHLAQFPKGVTTVQYKFTDENGVADSCSFTVTIEDNTAPTIDNCNDQELNTICGDAVLPDYTSNANTSDNCPMSEVRQVPAPGTSLGTLESLDSIYNGAGVVDTLQDNAYLWVNLIISDMAGLEDTCTFKITLNDDDLPTPLVDPLVDIIAGTTLDADCGYYELCAPAAITCNGDTIYGTTSANGLTAIPDGCGTGQPLYRFMGPDDWFLTWSFNAGNGRILQQTQSIILRADTLAPTLECYADKTYNTDAGECSKNVISDIAMTEIQPDTEPYLHPTDEPSAGQAIDNCGIDRWEYKIEQDGSVWATGNTSNAGNNLFPIGTHIISYYAYDAENNVDSCSFMVIIEDKENPTLDCLVGDVVNTNDPSLDAELGDCGLTIFDNAFLPNNVNDNCEIKDTSWIITSLTNGASATPSSGTGTLNGVFLDISAAENGVGDKIGYGEFQIEWTVRDSSDNPVSCSATFEIRDNISPEIVCPNDTIVEMVDATRCHYIINDDKLDASGADECGVDYYEYQINSGFPVTASTMQGDSLPIGVNTVKWKVYDYNGNVDSCEFTVEVLDKVDPVFACPLTSPVNLDNTTTDCSQDHRWREPSINDVTDCDIANVIITRVSSNMAVHDALNVNYGSYDQTDLNSFVKADFPVGQTFVYYIATDSEGNADTCTLEVNIADTEPPVFTNCPSGEELENICDSTQVPDYRILTDITDNCESKLTPVMQVPAPGTYLVDIPGLSLTDGETFQVTISVSDAFANFGSATCQFDVTIRDNQHPIPEVAGAFLDPLYTSCDSLIVDAPYATDCGEVIRGFTTSGQPLGANQYLFTSANGPTYNVEWVYTDDQLNQVSQFQVITVETDDVAPELVCPLDIDNYSSDPDSCYATGISSISITEGSFGTLTNGEYADSCSTGSDFTIFYTLSGATAKDTVYSSDAGADTFRVGITTVTYHVIDAAGNEATCDFDVEVIDDVAPVFTVSSDMTVQCDSVPALADIDAYDNCDGQISATGSEVRTDGSCANQYTLTRTWTAMDSEGNSSSATQVITVIDSKAPYATIPDGKLDVSVDAESGVCGANVSLILRSSDITDNCSSASNISITNNRTPNGNDATDFYSVGTHEIEFTMTDECGNDSTYIASVTVIDNERPVIGCLQGVSFSLPPSGSLNLVPTDLYSTLRDNCGMVDTVFMDQYEFTCADLDRSPITVTLTAVDTSGNQATCEATLNLLDTEDPTAACQDITVDLGADGIVTVSGEDLDNGSSDVCNRPLNYYINTVGNNSMDFDCSQAGVNSVNLIVEDPAGNTAICASNITVRDINVPEITCTDITIEVENSEITTIDSSMVVSSISDNCGTQLTVSLSRTDFTCADAGQTHSVLVEAFDGTNTASCNAQVTVQYAAPTAVCQDITVQLGEDGTLGEATINAEELDGGSTNACGGTSPLTFTIERNRFTCDDTDEVQEMWLVVEDEFGSKDSCLADITVISGELKVVVAEREGSQGSVIEIPITVENFEEITDLQFTLDVVDTDVAIIDSVSTGMFSGATMTKINDGRLHYSFTAPGATPITRINGSVIGYVFVELLGFDGDITELDINSDGLIMQWSSACRNGNTVNGFDAVNGSAEVNSSPIKYTMSGNVGLYYAADGVENVPVIVSNNGLGGDTVYTDALGNYSFEATSESNPTICPQSWNTSYADSRDFYLGKIGANQSVTAADQTRISEHLFNVNRFTSAYDMIAADVAPTAFNTPCDSGEVAGSDISLITQVLQGQDSWIQDAWVYITADHTFDSDICPWEDGPWPTCISLTNVSASENNLDFYGIKTGDVAHINSSNTLGANGYQEEYNASALIASNEDGSMEVVLENVANMRSFQFALSYPSNIEIDDLSKFDIGMMNYQVSNVKEKNQILFIGYDIHGLERSNLTLAEFNIDGYATSDDFEIVEDQIISEVMLGRDQYGKVIFDQSGLVNANEIDHNAFELLANRPNPFSEYTSIRFVTPSSGEALIRVFNSNGKEIFNDAINSAKGLNEYRLDASSLLGSGLYYYEIVTDRYSAGKSFILNK